MGFKARALELRKLIQETLDAPYVIATEAMSTGIAKSSFVADIIHDHFPHGMTEVDERDIKGAATAIYIAAAETVSLLKQCVHLPYIAITPDNDCVVYIYIGDGSLPRNL